MLLCFAKKAGRFSLKICWSVILPVKISNILFTGIIHSNKFLRNTPPLPQALRYVPNPAPFRRHNKRFKIWHFESLIKDKYRLKGAGEGLIYRNAEFRVPIVILALAGNIGKFFYFFTIFMECDRIKLA